MHVHAVLCLALRDQENLAKSIWNLLLDTERADSDRNGYGEYGGRMKRGTDQEEIMKARLRVCRELSKQQGILPVQVV